MHTIMQRSYAREQNLSVDEFIVSLINKFVAIRRSKRKPHAIGSQPLSSILQEVADMPRIGSIDLGDTNGEEARWEYYRDKYEL